MRTVITNGVLVLDDRLCSGLSLVVEDGRIAALQEGLPDQADQVLDAAGRYVSPGFSDLHVHGGGGHDFMDGTVEAVIGAARFHLSHGTTLLQPTTMTCSDRELEQVFAAFAQARAAGGPMPHLHGLHLEGPWLSPAQAGAQDPALLRIPDPDHVRRVLDGSPYITQVSAACELPGGLALGDELARRGILASIGHSGADYEQVCAALDHGYRHVTHLYSGMSSLHRRQARRYLGVVESAYLLDRLTVEIIADGVHLPPELLRLIVKCIPPERVALVTDATRGAGLPDGTVVKLGSRTAGQDVVVRDGVAYVMDGSCFGGSVCTADRCVRTMWKLAGMELPQALAMMTRTPCRILGLEGRKGRLAPGFDADLCLFDQDVRVSTVLVDGRILVDRGAVL